jgi:hypothetical protein
MAAFCLQTTTSNSIQSTRFTRFLKSVANYKSLEIPQNWVVGSQSLAAKFDAPSSLHRGCTKHDITGSWIIAVGTVVYKTDDTHKTVLSRLLDDYLDMGDKVFSKVDGQFALVLFDAVANVTKVISDPFGMIPVYYGQVHDQYFISTSGLAVASELQSEMNEFGARAFILYGSTFGDTIWKDILLIPPATVLKLDENGTHQSTYWSFDVDQSLLKLSESQSVDCMVESFTASLQHSLENEGKIWLSLTGGLDSRTIAALADYSKIPFKTYAHGPLDSRDVTLAEHISHKKEWEYEYFRLPNDWGLQRASWFDLVLGQMDGHLDIIKMSRTIREQAIKAQQMTVSLWGFGGELHRGIYWKHEFFLSNNNTNLNYDRLMDYRVIPSNVSILKNMNHWNPLLRNEIISRLRLVGEENPEWPVFTKLDMIGTLLERHVCGTTIASVLGQQRVILPFNLKENVLRSFSLNYRWRTHSRLFRSILERIAPDLAEIDTAEGGPAVQMNLTNLNRFFPYWLNSGEKLLWRIGNKIMGKPIWNRRETGNTGKAYPTEKWLKETLNVLERRSILTPGDMHSAALYDQTQLSSLLSSSHVGSLQKEAILGRILGLEMAMRSVNSKVKSAT